jgi:hypothetical protein
VIVLTETSGKKKGKKSFSGSSMMTRIPSFSCSYEYADNFQVIIIYDPYSKGISAILTLLKALFSCILPSRRLSPFSG